MTHRIVRDWVIRFNARGFGGLLDGRLRRAVDLIDLQRRALLKAVEPGPIAAIHGVVRRRLSTWCSGCTRSSRCRSTVSRELRAVSDRTESSGIHKGLKF